MYLLITTSHQPILSPWSASLEYSPIGPASLVISFSCLLSVALSHSFTSHTTWPNVHVPINTIEAL